MPMLRALALCLLLAAAPGWAQSLAAIPAFDSPVVDTTGTLEAAQKQALEQQALALQQRKGSQLQVLIVPSTQPEDIFDYTQRAFDQAKLGRKGVDDAVILVVAKDDRQARIHTGYGLEGAIPDAVANRIIQEYLVPKFRAGDFAGGIADATAVLVKLIDGETLPQPVSAHREGDGRRGGDWFFALFAAFVVATMVRGMFRRTPAGLRSLFTGGAAAGVALLLSSLVPAAIAGVFGLFYGLVAVSTHGGYARHRDWGGWGGGGGGWGGGGFGGGGGGFGGGWGGGGGMSGGGGASGSW